MRQRPPHPAVLENFRSKLRKLEAENTDGRLDTVIDHQRAAIAEYQQKLYAHNLRAARRDLAARRARAAG